jgi:hypothetical protein
MFKEQMHRMNHRIDEASERWTKEKRALEIEIEEWRGKLAETCGKLLAAENIKARHALTIMRLRQVLEWVNRRVDTDIQEKIRQALK